jgi:hypothetical protein
MVTLNALPGLRSATAQILNRHYAPTFSSSCSMAESDAPQPQKYRSSGQLRLGIREQPASWPRFANASRHQVEKLLIVKATRGTGVPGTLNLSGLDLQVRNRVCPGSIGQKQVPVQLIAVGSNSSLADQDISNPDRVSSGLPWRAPL